MGPSSWEASVFLWPLVLVILCGMQDAYQSSTQNNKYQVSQKQSCFSWWWAYSHLKHVEIDKYTKKKLCTKLVLFTRWVNLFFHLKLENKLWKMRYSTSRSCQSVISICWFSKLFYNTPLLTKKKICIVFKMNKCAFLQTPGTQLRFISYYNTIIFKTRGLHKHFRGAHYI